MAKQVIGYVPTSVPSGTKIGGNTIVNGVVTRDVTPSSSSSGAKKPTTTSSAPASTPVAQAVPVATTVTENYSSGGGGGGGSSSSSVDDERAKQAQASARAAMLSAFMAQSAYNNNNSALNSSVAARQKSLKDNYNAALKSLLGDYNLSKGNINDDAEASLKQAYINSMMNQKNLQQKLASQGITGGATESTVARLLNAYGNNRNNINSLRSKNLSSLENTYENNRNSALTNYNNALAQLEAERFAQAMAIQNAYTDRLYNAIGDYAASGAYDDGTYNQMMGAVLGNGGGNLAALIPYYTGGATMPNLAGLTGLY